MPPRFTSRTAPRFLPVALCVVLLGTTLPGTVHAAAYDGFDYPTGTMGPNLFGGHGFRDYWRYSNDDPPQIVAGSLSDPTGTLLTSGNHVRDDGFFSLGRGPLTDRPGAAAGGEYWVSFLMRRDTASTLPAWSGLGLDFDGRRLWMLEPGADHADGTLAISNGGDPVAVSSGVPFEAGRDYFLVTRIRTGKGNDPATLWVNPIPGVTPPESQGVIFSLFDVGTLSPTPQFWAAPGDSRVVHHFDELRTGTSYAEVAPVVPEPSAALIPLAALLLARRRSRVAHASGLPVI